MDEYIWSASAICIDCEKNIIGVECIESEVSEYRLWLTMIDLTWYRYTYYVYTAFYGIAIAITFHVARQRIVDEIKMRCGSIYYIQYMKANVHKNSTANDCQFARSLDNNK